MQIENMIPHVLQNLDVHYHQTQAILEMSKIKGKKRVGVERRLICSFIPARNT